MMRWLWASCCPPGTGSPRCAPTFRLSNSGGCFEAAVNAPPGRFRLGVKPRPSGACRPNERTLAGVGGRYRPRQCPAAARAVLFFVPRSNPMADWSTWSNRPAARPCTKVGAA
jgi:hypothetical protein